MCYLQRYKNWKLRTGSILKRTNHNPIPYSSCVAPCSSTRPPCFFSWFCISYAQNKMNQKKKYNYDIIFLHLLVRWGGFMDFRINIGYLRNCSCILPETLIFSHMNRMSLLINTYVHNHNYMIKKKLNKFVDEILLRKKKKIKRFTPIRLY